MVVISAAIFSKDKTLLARQFVAISRLRVEGLLSAFHRLIDSGSKEYTYIETESIRYVYLPIKSLYLVLLTNKNSNILEDLETVKLMQQVVLQCCESAVTEDTVLTKAFDIVFAFDEVISFGYRESVTLAQIKAYTEMESHDEKLSLLVQQEKMKEERKRGQEIASRLEKERKEQAKLEEAMAAKKMVKHAVSSFASAAVNAMALGNQPATLAGTTALGSMTSRPELSTEVSSSAGPKKGMKLGQTRPAPADLLGALRLTPTA